LWFCPLSPLHFCYRRPLSPSGSVAAVIEDRKMFPPKRKPRPEDFLAFLPRPDFGAGRGFLRYIHGARHLAGGAPAMEARSY
jgi:hypothetical protein